MGTNENLHDWKVDLNYAMFISVCKMLFIYGLVVCCNIIYTLRIFSHGCTKKIRKKTSC